MLGAARVEAAPAKVNLTLRVLGRRADGYHDIESLVVFAGVGDALTLRAGPRARADRARADRRGGRRDWRQSGAQGRARARRAGCRPRARPLRAVEAPAGRRRAWAAARPMPRRRCGCSRAPTASRSTIHACMQAARATGADVPVCLDPRPRMMRGIGDILSDPLDLPRLARRAGQSGRGGADQGRVRARCGCRRRTQSDCRAS